jgi:hypothetical protein
MNRTTEHHRDAVAQARADALERLQGVPSGPAGSRWPDDRPPGPPVDAAAVAEYRLLHRAVRAAPMPALPAGFATGVAARVRDLDESAEPERWTLMLAAACALAAGALFALPVTASVLQRAVAQLDGAPWPMLVTAAGALALVWVGDRIGSRLLQRPPVGSN